MPEYIAEISHICQRLSFLIIIESTVITVEWFVYMSVKFCASSNNNIHFFSELL